MEERKLIYKPAARARFKKSAIYAVPMFTKTFALASKYLLESIGKKTVSASTTDDYLQLFWRVHFDASYTSLYVAGDHNLVPGETYIFMSNHESWMDIPAIYGAVPTSLRMVSKIGLMQVPILGHAMVNAGFIAIDRKNRSRAIRQLGRAKERIAEGISIWIAPEGTRTRDGAIGPFKKGGFYLAKELNKSIVPVFIEGAAEVMPTDGISVFPNKSITVHFCEPVSADDVTHLASNELVNMVRGRIIAKQQSCQHDVAKDKP